MTARRSGPAAAAAGAAALLLLGGCAAANPPAPPAALPELAVIQPARPEPGARAQLASPLRDLPPGPPVTLTAVDEDVRVLLTALAEAAELNLVLGPEVQGRVSVALTEVPAREALELILAEAGLGLGTPPVAAPYGPVVFYVVPVNVDLASAALIWARYGVSAEMAEWIVKNRVIR